MSDPSSACAKCGILGSPDAVLHLVKGTPTDKPVYHCDDCLSCPWCGAQLPEDCICASCGKTVPDHLAICCDVDGSGHYCFDCCPRKGEHVQ